MNDNKKHSSNHNSRDQHRINEAITAREVRLTGDNVNQGIYPIQEALRIADRAGLDLVEIAAEANPPVCRVIDYQKFIYQKKKKLKEQKSNSVKVVIKEIRFGRSILFKDQGEVLLLRFATDLEDIATVESMPSLEGKRMFMMLAPKKGTAPKKPQPKPQVEAQAADSESK